jgi:hypothetical protein
MSDYPTSSEAEELLRRTNQFLASFLPARRITKPQVEISKKKAQSLRTAPKFHQRRRVEETTRKRSKKKRLTH